MSYDTLQNNPEWYAATRDMDYGKQVELLEKEIEIHTSAGDTGEVASLLFFLIGTYIRSGDPTRARETMDRCLNLPLMPGDASLLIAREAWEDLSDANYAYKFLQRREHIEALPKPPKPPLESRIQNWDDLPEEDQYRWRQLAEGQSLWWEFIKLSIRLGVVCELGWPDQELRDILRKLETYLYIGNICQDCLLKSLACVIRANQADEPKVTEYAAHLAAEILQHVWADAMRMEKFLTKTRRYKSVEKIESLMEELGIEPVDADIVPF